MFKKLAIILSGLLIILAVFLFANFVNNRGGENGIDNDEQIKSLDGCSISEENIGKLSQMGVVCDSICRYNNVDNQCGPCCVLNSAIMFSDWIFIGLLMAASFMFFYGAYLFVMTGQDPAKADKGKRFVMYAFIGIVVSFASKFIPFIAKLILKV
ncbi:MAG: hypothetical protein PHW52_03110 [Candidatus Pacebacteria bacterium]|nr:hypothetical protein [Candidatus Paceibacterota bacterium]